MDVLIVEGDPAFGRFAQDLVEGWGYPSELCSRGRDALRSFRNKDFDLVVIEVRLPDERTDRLIRGLKGIRPGARIVVMTDRNSYDVEVRIRALGILYYLIKPLEIESLKPLLDHLARGERNRTREAARQRLACGSHHQSKTRQNHCKKQEAPAMNLEINERIPYDNGIESKGICSTCDHLTSCILRRRNRKPVLFCEEYLPFEPQGRSSSRDRWPHWGRPLRSGSSHLGLCRTCARLKRCTAAKPGGGTWHCEDYENGEPG